MYARSDENFVMMMFFELFLLGKISEFPRCKSKLLMNCKDIMILKTSIFA